MRSIERMAALSPYGQGPQRTLDVAGNRRAGRAAAVSRRAGRRGAACRGRPYVVRDRIGAARCVGVVTLCYRPTISSAGDAHIVGKDVIGDAACIESRVDD